MTLWMGFLAEAAPLGFSLETWRNVITIAAFFMPFFVGGALYWGAKYFLPCSVHIATRKETARNIRELKDSDVAVRDLVQQCMGKVGLIEELLKDTSRDRAGLHEHMGRSEEQAQEALRETARMRERMARVEERLQIRRSGDDGSHQ